MKFKDLKLGTKLGLGFGVVLVLATIAITIGFIGFNNVIGRVDKSTDVRDIVDETLQMRRHEKDFMLRKDVKYITQVHERVNNITQIAEQARDKHSKQADKDEKNDIIKKAQEYKVAFDKYVALETEKNDNMASMRSTGHLVIDDLNKVQAIIMDFVNRNSDLNASKRYAILLSDVGDITELFLEIRKGEKDVIIFNEQKYYDKLKTNFKKVIETTQGIRRNITQAESVKLIEETLENLELYKTGFENFYSSMQSQKNEAAIMVGFAREVIELSEKAAAYQTGRMFKQIQQAKSMLVVFSLIAIVLGIFIAFLITRGITVPVAKGVAFANIIANGDLTTELEIDQDDEIGKLAEAMKRMSEKLKDIISNIVLGSQNIASASQQVSSTSQQLSQGASEQASSIEEVSSTMEEISSNIEQNTQNAQQTEKVSAEANTGIKEVSERSYQAVEANKTIADKITIINDIAFQTNILALNAAVEAARAGEHGKGFAVVAAEVRKLAERSKIAAEEIVTLAQSSLELATDAGEVMVNTIPKIENTSNLVQEISAASIEQNNGAGQVNNAIQQLSNVTQQNAAASEELATSAEELASQAEQLKETMAYFNIGIKTTMDFTENNIRKNKVRNPKSDKIALETKSDIVNFNMNDKTDDEFTNF